jgi:hypothetical protein
MDERSKAIVVVLSWGGNLIAAGLDTGQQACLAERAPDVCLVRRRVLESRVEDRLRVSWVHVVLKGCWDEGRRLTLDERGCVNPSLEREGSNRHKNPAALAAQDLDGDAVKQQHHSGKKGQPARRHPRIVPRMITMMISIAVFMRSPVQGLGSVLREVIRSQR